VVPLPSDEPQGVELVVLAPWGSPAKASRGSMTYAQCIGSSLSVKLALGESSLTCWWDAVPQSRRRRAIGQTMESDPAEIPVGAGLGGNAVKHTCMHSLRAGGAAGFRQEVLDKVIHPDSLAPGLCAHKITSATPPLGFKAQNVQCHHGLPPLAGPSRKT
jgi:hypothetical protein